MFDEELGPGPGIREQPGSRTGVIDTPRRSADRKIRDEIAAVPKTSALCLGRRACAFGYSELLRLAAVARVKAALTDTAISGVIDLVCVNREGRKIVIRKAHCH
jgi:hypothetical protein